MKVSRSRTLVIGGVPSGVNPSCRGVSRRCIRADPRPHCAAFAGHGRPAQRRLPRRDSFPKCQLRDGVPDAWLLVQFRSCIRQSVLRILVALQRPSRWSADRPYRARAMDLAKSSADQYLANQDSGRGAKHATNTRPAGLAIGGTVTTVSCLDEVVI